MTDTGLWSWPWLLVTGGSSLLTSKRLFYVHLVLRHIARHASFSTNKGLLGSSNHCHLSSLQTIYRCNLVQRLWTWFIYLFIPDDDTTCDSSCFLCIDLLIKLVTIKQNNHTEHQCHLAWVKVAPLRGPNTGKYAVQVYIHTHTCIHMHSAYILIHICKHTSINMHIHTLMHASVKQIIN